MRNPRTLPIIIPPANGESFAGYLDRLAASFGVPLLTILARTGLVEEEKFSRPPIGYGIVLSSQRLEHFSYVMRLPESAVSNLLLARYHGICCDFSGLDAQSVRSLSITALSQWAYFSGTHVCPKCLNESGGVWKLSWKVPWSFACVHHENLLVDTCPGCERRTGVGRQDSRLAPSFPSYVLDPIVCRNAHARGQASLGRSAKPCGYPLATMTTDGLVTYPVLLTAQQQLNLALQGDRMEVGGERVSSLDYFSDLRSLVALVMATGEPEDLGDVPASVSDAYALFLEDRNRWYRARSGKETFTGGHLPISQYRRPYNRPPQSAALMAAVTPMAMSILRASSPEMLAMLLKPHIDRLERQRVDPPLRVGYLRFSPQLKAAFDACWRPHQKLTRRLGLHASPEKDPDPNLASLQPDNVPQLFWLNHFEASLRELLPGIAPDYARRVCSMWLVKALGNYAWAGAAEKLGLPPKQSSQLASKVVSLLNAEGNAELFDTRIREAARKVASGSKQIDYGARRRFLANFTDIERESWKTICRDARVPMGKRGGKSRYAAAWLWSRLTEGDYRCSPGFREKDGETERELYRRFVKCDLPPLEAALVQYGSGLTASLDGAT